MSRLKELFDRYERHVSLAAFTAGFLWDSLTLQRIDLIYENLVFIFYLAVAGLGIFIINMYESGGLRGGLLERVAEFISLPLQFAFGGLFSGFFIFYFRSGTLIGSLPFLILLLGILVGNEFFRKRYLRLPFHLGVYFVALFSYATFALPVVFKKIGPEVFIFSGLASLGVMALVIFGIARLVPVRFRESRRGVFASVGTIYLLFNLFYFTDFIPPIPLALKEAGVYHSVKRTGEEYEIKFEKRKFFFDPALEFFKSGAGWEPRTIHHPAGGPVYVFSAIFAPTELQTKIFHRWAHYDRESDEWRVTDRIGFNMAGGRDGGYRGFSFKENIPAGYWRVDVITERGELLGRVKFEVIETATPPELETKFR